VITFTEEEKAAIRAEMQRADRETKAWVEQDDRRIREARDARLNRLHADDTGAEDTEQKRATNKVNKG